MSRETFKAYFSSIERQLSEVAGAEVKSFKALILSSERANLRLRIRFNNRELLAVSEALLIISSKISQIDYRYHFQDEHNKLIFRYDSTRHFPDIETFPHHKHLPTTVIPTEKPNFFDVLEEAVSVINQKER
ncbi:MAG: toxin TumE [Cyanobacteria bacterium J06634_6]